MFALPTVRRCLSAVVLACSLMGMKLTAQTISPHLVGNNLWLANRSSPGSTPSTSVMNLAGAAGIRLIRIGGNEFNQNMPSDTALLTWVNRIRAIGAEPLIQISQTRSITQAAATVQFINTTSGANVRYWSIGNEPWLKARNTQDPDPTEAEMASQIEAYFKPLAAAMKEADPSIRIFGVDSEDFQSGLHARLFGGSNNIAGKVPGRDYYYCDGLSWHRYPQADNIDPAYEGLADIRGRIENCRALIDSVNLSQNRTGDNALVWAIGEFNAKNGPAVHTWGNGQMFAGVFGLAMKHGCEFAAAWSLYESDGKRTSSDFGLLDGSGLVPRASYWHSQFASRYLTGRYLEGNPSISSNTSDLLVYGAEDVTKEQLSVIILNRGSGAPRPYTLHLNRDGTFTAAGATALNVDASRWETHNDTIAPRSTHVLAFRRDSLTRIVYTSDDFTAGQPPLTTIIPRSPLRGVLDAFDAYGDIAQQGYWKPLHNGSGQATLTAGRMLLRASDTANASATIGSPVSTDFNFFKRGYAITLDGFTQTSAQLPDEDVQFRLCLNSTCNRSFPADDSLVLRITPQRIRLGYKLNQTGVQGELRAGTPVTPGFLLDENISGTPRTIRLSLEPTGTIAGETTIHYQLQIDGSSGRITRNGFFTATRSDWGANGDSSLVLESRRDDPAAGGNTSFVEAGIDSVSLQPLALDAFDSTTGLTGQNYWQTLLVGSSSSAALSGGAANLNAQSLAFASSAIAGTVIPELNFFQRGFTLDVRDLALTPNNILPDEAFFRISLCSTPQRSFTTPDALTLRITPERIRFGYKLDQPSVDAELRTGTAAADSSLIDETSPGLITGVRLTLIPIGPAGPSTPVLFAMRLTSALGETIRTGTVNADWSRWGSNGDSSLVLEARRASPSTGDASSYMRVSIGSVSFTPLPDDLFTEAPAFDTWRLNRFSSEELASSGISGIDANPAGDGVSNLLKYAFGLDPKQPVKPGDLPYLEAPAGNPVRFVHSERDGASDLSYQVEASADLIDWTLPIVEESRVFSPDGWFSVATSATAPPGQGRLFFRVRVTHPPAP